MGRFKDLTGQRFGMLTVICRAPDIYSKSGNKVTMWRCKCDCGGVKDVRASCLINGDTQSCGCVSHKSEVYRDAALIHQRPPRPITIQDSLIIGQYYRLKKKWMKLIGKYDSFARFEAETGLTESFLYWDLERMLKGGET